MEKIRKECYGVLEKVFPMGKEGLREVVPACFDCADKVSCLREAMETEQGLKFKGEIIRRSPTKGLADRLRRWSENKELNRRLTLKKGNKT